jgi:ribonuclease HI
MKLKIYTDGACKGNPGRGGWGAYLVFGEHTKEICGGNPMTTNNQMELQAVSEALNCLNQSTELTIVTDSQYVKNGIEKWMTNWKKNGWKTAAKKPVKNKEYWLDLDEALQRHTVSWESNKGHSGHPGNEKAED